LGEGEVTLNLTVRGKKTITPLYDVVEFESKKYQMLKISVDSKDYRDRDEINRFKSSHHQTKVYAGAGRRSKSGVQSVYFSN